MNENRDIINVIENLEIQVEHLRKLLVKRDLENKEEISLSGVMAIEKVDIIKNNIYNLAKII